VLYDLQYFVETLDGKTLISDVTEVNLDEDIKELLNQTMSSIFQTNRTYVSFEVRGKTVYLNPSNIVTITPIYKEKS